MAPDVAPPAIVVSSENVERQFQYALHLIGIDQVADAIPILKSLHLQAETPRVRLELARALMLSEQWEEARQLFVAAFKDDPPPVVKANILNLINHIDRRMGKLSLTASLARYGNPLQQPGTYTLNFAGIDLVYEPDHKYRNVWGVNVGGGYTKEFDRGWQMSATAAYRDLPHNLADRFTGEVSLSRPVGSALEVKLGATRLGQKGQSFTLPYAQAAYAIPLNRRSAIRPTVTVGYYAADVGRGSSGWQADVFAPYVYSPLPTKVLAVGPTVFKRTAGYSEQAYLSYGLRALASLQTPAINCPSSEHLAQLAA